MLYLLISLIAFELVAKWQTANQQQQQKPSAHRTTNEPHQNIKEESKAGQALSGRLVMLSETLC